MSVLLQISVPYNDPVTVCAGCKRACCLRAYEHRCTAARRGPRATAQLPLALLTQAALEHPSYWKGAENGDPDVPADLDMLAELIRNVRARHGTERSLLLAYLVVQLDLDVTQVAAVMAREWPEMKEV